MLALCVELLTGRYVASAYNDRGKVEWPPHPARLFSALVATWADASSSTQDGAERAALEWLEAQPAPDIYAESGTTLAARTAMPVFVPVNDVAQVAHVDRDKLDQTQAELATATDDKTRARLQKVVDKLELKLLADTAKAVAVPRRMPKDSDVGLDVLPEHRGRQPRTFPSAAPLPPRVVFCWPEAPPSPVSTALDTLTARMARLGHSSSLVRVSRVDPDHLAPVTGGCARYRADERDGEHSIRWVERGQLGRLEAAFERHRETEPRVLPAAFVRYTQRRPETPAPCVRSVFDPELIVFGREHGPRFPATAVIDVCRQFRRALMSVADQPVHRVLSGHEPDGSATTVPHVAIVGLPAVGGPYPDGALIGLAVVLPRALEAAARSAVLRAIGALEQPRAGERAGEPASIELRLGAAGVLVLRRITWGAEKWTLRPATWCSASTRWATVTPIALDRNPGDLLAVDPAKRRAAFLAATETVKRSLEHVGVAVPTAVEVSRSCLVAGTTKPRHFPRFPGDPERPQRVLVHARIEFEDPVEGPLILGAGRHLGLGLCMPLPPEANR